MGQNNDAQNAALIQAGANVLGQAAGYAAQANLNKKMRDYNREMYARQRADSLSDWAMQNEYNHPSSQMARLREAKLNPNLVYGNGVDGNAAQAVRSSDAGSWNPRTAPIDIGGAASAGLSTYYDVQLKQAQIDNLRTSNTVMEQEKLLKAANVLNTTADTRTKEFDLGLKNEIKKYSVEAARVGVNKTLADTQYTLDQNFRSQLLADASLSENAERIMNLQAERATSAAQRQKIYAEIKNLKRDGTLKDLEINLRRNGVSSSDPLYMRILAQVLAQHGINPTSPQ